MRTNARYAFIVPRFGAGAGGAETLVAGLAAHLKKRGDIVEVWSTCARDNRTWENYYPEGISTELGVLARRFAVNPRDLEQWIPRQINISEGMNLPIDEQLTWMQEGVNSDGLYAHIGHFGKNFDALFFAPYLFGTTFWGSLIRPANSYLIPCLHDECYAYVDIIESMFRQIGGALFNCRPEANLARRLYGKIPGGEVGMGFVEHPPEFLDALEPYFAESFPYLLYLGRKETGKNVQLLIDYFIALRDRGLGPKNLKLVIVGGGSFDDLHRPGVLSRGDILDIEHLSERDKARLIRNALALCQPSVNESFSIVLMESWLLGTPVIVHGNCEVTRYHAVESGGGLYFADALDFAGVVQELCSNNELRARLAASGLQYVREHYSWSAVLSRFDSTMESLRR